MKATWNGVTVAESDDINVVERNPYFPKDSLDMTHFESSSHRTTCPWKGVAHYFDVIVDGQRNANAAWYYPEPKPAAAEVTDRVAFWKGVKTT